MKQWIPLKIVLVTGVFMLIQYFIPREEAEFFYEYMIDFTIIIGIFALILGIVSLVRVSWDKVRRKAQNWGYSLIIILGLVAMLFFGWWPARVGNVGDGPSGIAVGDVDFDQDNDIIVSNMQTNNISIFKNKGDGLFVSAYTYPAGKAPSDVVVLDIDDDNDQDLAVANSEGNTVSVLINEASADDFENSRLQITPDRRIDKAYNVGKPKFAKPVEYDVGEMPVSLARGDLNGDGMANDIAVANKAGNSISVLISDGQGGFREANNISVGTAPVDVYIADFDGDLTNDIVVANQESANISFLAGTGNGSFASPQTFAVEGGKVNALTPGDFDQNGFLDLAVVATDPEDNSGNIHVLLSDTTGLFVTDQVFATANNPVDITGEDIDLDGIRDLVVVGAGDNMIWIHRNDGDAGFFQRARYFAGREPEAVATAMLTETGRPGLISANMLSNNVSTFTNRGDMDFEPGANIQSGDILFLGGGLNNYFYVAFFDNIMIPIQATMFSLLAFYIASAAYRAFRARTLLSTILLVAALIIMIRFVPMGPISVWVSELSSWLLKIPNMAAKRAIFIGVGLGMVATAIKVLLGVERGYLGRD